MLDERQAQRTAVARFGGFNVPGPVATSSGTDSLLVRFVSDGSHTAKGFEARFDFLQPTTRISTFQYGLNISFLRAGYI